MAVGALKRWRSDPSGANCATVEERSPGTPGEVGEVDVVLFVNEVGRDVEGVGGDGGGVFVVEGLRDFFQFRFGCFVCDGFPLGHDVERLSGGAEELLADVEVPAGVLREAGVDALLHFADGESFKRRLVGGFAEMGLAERQQFFVVVEERGAVGGDREAVRVFGFQFGFAGERATVARCWGCVSFSQAFSS